MRVFPAIRVPIGMLLLAAAGCLSSLGREAILQFEGFPGDPRGGETLLRGERELAAGHADAAAAIATRLREAFPNNILVHRLYQDSLQAAGRSPELAAEYQEFAASRPSALAYTLLSRLQTDPALGESYAMRAIDVDDRFPWAWYARAWWAAKQPHEAKKQESELWFERALQLYPDFFPAMRAYAVLYRDKNAGAALGAIEKYVKKYPERREERIFLAALRLAVNQIDRAEREFRALVEENPDDVESAKGLAAVLLEKEQVDEARRIYVSIIQRFPEDPASEFNLGVVSEIYEGNPAAAIQHYRNFLLKGESQPFLLQARARLWLQELESAQSREAAASAPSPPPR